jgi:superfamily II DNA/RNA helicase
LNPFPLIHRCEKDVLVDLLKEHKKEDKVIVFCNTIDSCRSTEHFLREKGFTTSCYHGDIPPLERKQNYVDFLEGEKPILVCTDVASRGIDTTEVDHVILFDFPLNVIDYIHRVGRTARAARPGRVTSLVRKKDRYLADGIQAAVREGRSLEGVSGAPPTSAEKSPTTRRNEADDDEDDE